MKKSFLLVLLIFINSCGYTSVYKNYDDQNINLTITEMEGDRDMNNLIKNEINLYTDNNADKKFNLKVKTTYNKKIIAKNKTGTITDYELFVSARFIILFNDKTQTFTFEENINVKNKKNTFEQNLYEKNLKKNFASSIKEKLILKLLNIK